MSDLAKRTAKLPPEKRQLIAQKLQKKLLSRQLQKNKEGTTQAQILPQKRETSTFPLSFAQGRLWFIHQLEPQSTVYNIPLTLRLTGGLRVDALDYSLAMIVQRHEVLRTTFTVQAEQPVQIIAASLSIQIAVIELQGIATERLDHLVVELACTEEQRPFNLTHGPLLRAYLLRLAPQEHIFLFTLHHIITDEWSMDVLLREMTTHYRAYINGDVDRPDKTHSPLPTLPIQYVDYALWQRQWLQGEVLSSQLAYWREQLAGAPALLTQIGRAHV